MIPLETSQDMASCIDEVQKVLDKYNCQLIAEHEITQELFDEMEKAFHDKEPKMLLRLEQPAIRVIHNG